MEKESNSVEEAGKILLPVPWQSWTIEFSRLLPVGEIAGEQPLIEDFMDAHLAKFLDMKPIQVKKLFRYKWTILKKGSHRYKLEVFAADFTFTICKDDNRYIIFRKGIIFKGSDKNTVKLKPPEV
jgi:hypothetical protein